MSEIEMIEAIKELADKMTNFDCGTKECRDCIFGRKINYFGNKVGVCWAIRHSEFAIEGKK